MSRRSKIGLATVIWPCICSCNLDLPLPDLAARCIVEFLIMHDPPGTHAQVTASVTDNSVAGSPPMDLQPNQSFSVNGVVLQRADVGKYSGGLDALFYSNQYIISFNNDGIITSMKFPPPIDRTITAPAPGSQVSRAGFDVRWHPAGRTLPYFPESFMDVDLEISGFVADGDDADLDPDFKIVTLTISAWEDYKGFDTITAADLNDYLNGPITVKFINYRQADAKLGMAGGTVRVQINMEIPLLLTD